MNYDDDQLSNDFESIARAYAKSLKNKGFVFIKLGDHDTKSLTKVISQLFGEILSLFDDIKDEVDCFEIQTETLKEYSHFCKKFGEEKQKYSVKHTDVHFLVALIALEINLAQNLHELAEDTGEFEFVNSIEKRRAKIYSTSANIMNLFEEIN